MVTKGSTVSKVKWASQKGRVFIVKLQCELHYHTVRKNDRKLTIAWAHGKENGKPGVLVSRDNKVRLGRNGHEVHTTGDTLGPINQYRSMVLLLTVI